MEYFNFFSFSLLLWNIDVINSIILYVSHLNARRFQEDVYSWLVWIKNLKKKILKHILMVQQTAWIWLHAQNFTHLIW